VSPSGCQPGFEAYKGPIYSIANTIGPTPDSLGEGNFTPAEGYDLMLLIDVRALRGHIWNPYSWVVISAAHVEGVRSLSVKDIHAWLREQPTCVGPDGHLSREAVVAWVSSNKGFVESWLEQHSQEEAVEFTETFGPSQSTE
jgi:hypothetical protein